MRTGGTGYTASQRSYCLIPKTVRVRSRGARTAFDIGCRDDLVEILNGRAHAKELDVAGHEEEEECNPWGSP